MFLDVTQSKQIRLPSIGGIDEIVYLQISTCNMKSIDSELSQGVFLFSALLTTELVETNGRKMLQTYNCIIRQKVENGINVDKTPDNAVREK